MPTTLDTLPQAESRTTARRESPAHPELTSEPATAPHANPTPEPKPYKPLHTNETEGVVKTKAAAPDPPSVPTPPTDPTPLEQSILDIFNDM